MDISRFFIDRPRFAAVLSIVIFLLGLLSIFRLPVSEYPEVAPPQIVVRAQFPGANPRVISETVATPLEEQINGVENLLYFDSQASADGSLTLTVTFKIGTNPEVAETAVQNEQGENSHTAYKERQKITVKARLTRGMRQRARSDKDR